MKILAFTDIHGVYKKVEEIINYETADVVILGGDLTNIGSVKEVDVIIEKFRLLSRELFCIAGNMDLPQHDILFSQKNIGLNGNGVVLDDVGFFGVSASPYSPLKTPYEVSEETIAEKIKQGYSKIKNAKKRILISHAPPYGTKLDVTHSGIHVGSTTVREFIEDHQPDLVVCGHIHEARGKDAIDKTIIVNCGAANKGYYVMVEIQEAIEVYLKERKL